MHARPAFRCSRRVTSGKISLDRQGALVARKRLDRVRTKRRTATAGTAPVSLRPRQQTNTRSHARPHHTLAGAPPARARTPCCAPGLHTAPALFSSDPAPSVKMHARARRPRQAPPARSRRGSPEQSPAPARPCPAQTLARRARACVMFSVDTTSAYLPGSVRSRRCARPIAITPALQPMPARLNESRSERMRKWLAIMADSDGVGLNSEQLTTRMSMSLAARPARRRSRCRRRAGPRRAGPGPAYGWGHCCGSCQSWAGKPCYRTPHRHHALHLPPQGTGGTVLLLPCAPRSTL